MHLSKTGHLTILNSACVFTFLFFQGADQDCGSVCGVLLHVQETGEDRSQRDSNLRPSRFTSGEAQRGCGGH